MSRFRFIPKAAPTISRTAMYDIVQTPVITEKATMGSEHNQVTFRVPLDADKRAVKVAVESSVQGQGRGGQYRARQRQAQNDPRPQGPTVRLQESDRHPGRGFEDRRVGGSLRWR